MSEDREPFFNPSERKMTVIFRPMLWGQWWRTEPLPAKRPVVIIVVLLVAMLGYGAYQLTIPTDKSPNARPDG